MLRKFAALAVGALAMVVSFAVYCDRSCRAVSAERRRQLPGDEFIPHAVATVTHAITIGVPPAEVWPWLAQMGSGRAGWYAYDFIDNGRHPSANRILAEFLRIGVGAVFPALPGATDAFVVARCEKDRDLVLSWRSPAGTYFTTWAFVLEQEGPSRTRLLVRGRASPAYRPFGLPLWISRRIAPLAHAVMERKQLLDIKARAEARWSAQLSHSPQSAAAAR